MADRFRANVAIVTGVGQGIGAAIAGCFAAEGARVIRIGWTAVFLASDKAPFINAETIVVDGAARRSTTTKQHGRNDREISSADRCCRIEPDCCRTRR